MTEVSPERLAAGVERLAVRTPTLPPATHTNAILAGTREAVLIEPASPYPEEIDRLLAWIAASGLTLRAVLVTHHHLDHVGGAARVKERLGLPLWGHARTIERLEGALSFDRAIEDGERIELDGPEPVVLRAVHTPGHAPGHLCFLEERSRVLVAGDMVASVGTIIVEPIDGDMQLYLASLERMKTLAPSMLIPAHGDTIRAPIEKLDAYIAHRLMRERKVLDALAHEGRARPVDLVPLAYDDAPRSVWPLAERSLEAHLIKLEREGRAARRGDVWSAP